MKRGGRGGRGARKEAGGGPDAAVWRALASPVRRAVLELLRAGPRTTGEIAALLPGTRYAAMKHLAVLEGAGLLAVERRGRERWNRLEARALARLLRRWAERYGCPRARRGPGSPTSASTSRGAAGSPAGRPGRGPRPRG